MTMTFQQESFSACLGELRILFEENYKEVPLHSRAVFAPRYDQYMLLEKTGKLFLVTVRSEATLVGYYLGLVDYHLHHANLLVCTLDTVYIRPEYRIQFLAVKLIRYVEEELRIKGVDFCFTGFCVKSRLAGFFEFLNYDPAEVYHSKWLGD